MRQALTAAQELLRGRTQNIQLMSLTLEVLKFSAWLNELAPCR